MRNNKLYYWYIHFAPGSAEVTDEHSQAQLQTARFRIQIIPEHRIAIEAHDDPADPADSGTAPRRLEVLRDYVLATKSIDRQRLIDPQRLVEMHTHSGPCCKDFSGELARRAEIYLFPRVASLFPDVGDPFLSCKEFCALDSAIHAEMAHDTQRCEQLDEKHSKVEWKRIVGHDSLKKWIEAGAYHPLYFQGG
jgi:hypothetical protein